jgi:hypothetical protein
MINKINKERRGSMNANPTRPVARSPGGPQTKTGQDTRQSMGRLTTKIIHKNKQSATDKEPKENKQIIE